MKRLYVTFSGDCYHEQTKRTVETAAQFGVDRLLVYDDWWLYNKRPEYVRQQQWLFDCPHEGNKTYPPSPKAVAVNYCSFKPLVILDALERFCEPGDLLAYVDADCVPVSSLQPLYDICAKDGIMLFGMNCYTQKQWCKKECFQTMGQDEQKYYEATACCATYMLFQKPALSTRNLPMQLLWEWFAYSHNPIATTFKDSLHLGNDASFKEHRNEQAILGNLAHKYGFGLWSMAEHGAPGYYPAVFHQLHGKTYGPERGSGSAFRNVNN